LILFLESQIILGSAIEHAYGSGFSIEYQYVYVGHKIFFQLL